MVTHDVTALVWIVLIQILILQLVLYENKSCLISLWPSFLILNTRMKTVMLHYRVNA